MPFTADRLTATNLFGSFAAAGTTPPKAVDDAWVKLQKVTAGLGRLGPARDAAAVAIIAALLDDRDPAADVEVQRVVTAQAIANAATDQTVAAVLYDGFSAVVRAHAERIVATWRPPFDQAAATLADVLEHLGPVSLDDTTTIVHKGGDAAEQWARAQASLATLADLRTGWLALDTFSTGRTPTRRHAMLTIADVDHDDWERLGLTDQKPDPWFATVNGLRLSMPTPAEFTQRIRCLDQAVQAAAQREADRDRDRLTGRRPVSALS